MNKKNKLKIGIILIIMILMSFTGCTSPDISPRNHRFAYDTESINFAIDKQNNLHLVWQERIDDEIIVYYTKLDRYGNDIINDKKIYSMKIPRRIHKDPDLSIDSNNNIHIIFAINNTLYYTKLNDNGKYIINPTRLTNNNCSTDGDILIDLNDNLHIVWTNWRSGKALIYYTKISNSGDILIEEKILSQNNSYDPSIIIDSKENIFVCWYFEWLNEGIWDTTKHRQICYMKMNTNGEILKKTNLDILGDYYKQSSIEMCINSKDQIGIIWTFKDKLKYFPLEMLHEEKKSPQTINKDFHIENDFLYYLDFNEFGFNQKYLIEINLTKQKLGRSLGDIFINRNGSEFKKIGSWFFEFRKDTNVLTLEYDVTTYVKSNGLYKIRFEKNEGITDPEIQNVRILSIPQPSEKKYGYILSPKVVIEPAINVDKNDNNNFVWYDSVEGDSELFYMKSDYNGNKIINKTQITFVMGKSYDPAIKLDSIGNIYIVWLDKRTGENAIYFMKMNGKCNKTISDKKISDNRISLIETSKFSREKNKKPLNIILILIEVLKYIFIIFIILFLVIFYQKIIIKWVGEK